MYFNNNNNFFHGIMFHHFNDEKLHKKSGNEQGSISKDQFYKIINFIEKKNILDADVFFDKLREKKLKKNEVCLTFDDAIKSQYNIALPVLNDLKIKSFFFIPTAIYDHKNQSTLIEVFRHFRLNYFENIDEFYLNFNKLVEKDLNAFFKKVEKNISIKKKFFPFYSTADIKFRLIRDLFLTKQEYESIMLFMMNEKKYLPNEHSSILYLNKNDLNQLKSLGHSIGLHSHNHPTLLENLTSEVQKLEYEKCLSIICNILDIEKSEIKSMSHPSGSYNENTLEILKDLGIEIGFKSIMNIETEKGMKKINNSSLEIARQDHSLILKKIK
jgi:peptidoglycan/xylan/chitin deacetylase (PgdA/CDA1 family)